jgi:hypothetical protein
MNCFNIHCWFVYILYIFWVQNVMRWMVSIFIVDLFIFYIFYVQNVMRWMNCFNIHCWFFIFLGSKRDEMNGLFQYSLLICLFFIFGGGFKTWWDEWIVSIFIVDLFIFYFLGGSKRDEMNALFQYSLLFFYFIFLIFCERVLFACGQEVACAFSKFYPRHLRTEAIGYWLNSIRLLMKTCL